MLTQSLYIFALDLFPVIVEVASLDTGEFTSHDLAWSSIRQSLPVLHLTEGGPFAE